MLLHVSKQLSDLIDNIIEILDNVKLNISKQKHKSNLDLIEIKNDVNAFKKILIAKAESVNACVNIFITNQKLLDEDFAKFRKSKKKSTKESVEVYIKGAGVPILKAAETAYIAVIDEVQSMQDYILIDVNNFIKKLTNIYNNSELACIYNSNILLTNLAKCLISIEPIDEV